jgi:lipid A ethanolaminephosphotransferase
MRTEKVIYFPSTASCGTVTTVSVPCIFSGLGRAHYSDSKARAQENLIDMMKHAKARVMWLDNDGDCKGVCKAAEVEDFNDATHPKYCRNGERGECIDEIMLDGLEQKLANPERDTFLVLHIKGSHGPAYFKRYPPQFGVFQPACQSNELSACSRDELVNAYDNTILYTDHILGEVIALLRRVSTQYTTSMFYVSDHGESLGENGLYLHGAPYAIAPDVQTRVPMLAWLSPEFIAAEKWEPTCLQALPRADKSHDYIFSTLLGMMGIATQEYDRKLDLFQSCHRQ